MKFATELDPLFHRILFKYTMVFANNEHAMIDQS